MRILDIKADDIMSEVVVVIEEGMLVSQVAHLMLRDRVSSFPVIDKKKKVIGIVTMTDFFHMMNEAINNTEGDVTPQIDSFKNKRVCDVMSTSVHVISPETTLDEIIHDSVHKGIHTFPVMADEKLVGIIGRHDILNATFSL